MTIEIRDLSKRYKNHEALRNLSLSVHEGGALIVVGANGAGKTTIIKILMNLIEATSGTAEILGVDSRRLSPKQLAQIGYVSEDQLLPGKLTVSEYFNYLRPFYPTWDKQLEAETLKQFRLPGDRHIHALSHGMRVKMALACALPYRPKLLVLDEPCSGLDPLVRDEFMEGLMEQAGEMTVLMSTHELSEVEGFGTDVAYVEEGRLMFHESMEELTGRMQEIRVTTSRKGGYRLPPPKSWIDVKGGWKRRHVCASRIPRKRARSSSASEYRRRSPHRSDSDASTIDLCLTGPCGTRPEHLRRRRLWCGTSSEKTGSLRGSFRGPWP